MNLFITGWASPLPNSLDSTKLAAKYKTMENIQQNAEEIFPKNADVIAAWSMGAIITLGILEDNPLSQLKRVILISPTLKFCCNNEMAAELKIMKRGIAKNKEAAMKSFAKICGVPDKITESEPCIYSSDELLAGLDFLEETEFRNIIKPKNCEISIICGEKDKIIPLASSLEVAEMLEVKPIIIPNGNHFDAFNYWCTALRYSQN